MDKLWFPLPIYDVPRRCACGLEWLGKSFQAVQPKEVLPRAGMCAPCCEREDSATRALVRPPHAQTTPDLELTPPAEVGEL